MAKASFLGVVSFGRFVPDWGSGSVTMWVINPNQKVDRANFALQHTSRKLGMSKIFETSLILPLGLSSEICAMPTA
jgi:hypothetical protein